MRAARTDGGQSMNDEVSDSGSSGRTLRVDDGVTLREFLRFIRRNRRIALIAGFVGCIAAATAALLVTPKYTAEVLLLPVTDRDQSLSSGGALGSAVGGLGGLASLAGLNLNGAGGMKAEALATLQSEVLTETYVQQHDLLPILYRKLWDPATKSWRTRNPRKLPTLWKANRLFEHSIRTVDDDPKTGIVTMSIEWKDPSQAAEWANGLVSLTNDYLRQKAIDDAQRTIAYLNQEIAQTNTVEVKSALYEFMEQQIRKEMVAKGTKEFALKVVDPAVPPELKTYPNGSLWTLGGGLGGVFLGLLVAVVKESLAEGERDTEAAAVRGRKMRPAPIPVASGTQSS
jgi:capsular polysaccharide biosynthesis protein